MIEVSVLIVHYKTLQLTSDCIQSIETHTKGVSYEVIVIDNDSQDGAKEIITSTFKSVRWVDMGYNAGFARANNAGIKAAKGQYIALLNSDTYLLDDLLAKSVQQITREPDVAACGGIQLYENQTPRPFFKSIAAFRRFQFLYPPSAFVDKLLIKCYPDRIFSDPEEVEWIPAAYLMTKREVIDKVGMLDEQFFMYGEDIEWNCRLATAGRLKVYHNCRYVHLEWGSKPERKEANITPINRIFPQITLSNLVWIRKQYGIGQFLLLMLNYWSMIVVYYGWKMIVNLKNGKNPLSELDNQHDFAKKIKRISAYFWKIIFQKPYFYQLKKDT
jgi:GT2 family glycosyltransferase